MDSSWEMKRQEPLYGWVIVAASFLVAATTYGASYSFGVFLPSFRESLGATSAAISGAYSLAMFLNMTSGIFAGWGVDKYGPRVTTVLGGLLLGVGLLLTSRVSTVWQLYLTYTLIGIAMSSNYAPLMTTVSQWFIRRRGLAVGITSAGMGSGLLIMAPVVSYLISSQGWRFAFLVLASTSVLILAAALVLKRSPAPTSRFSSGEGHHPVPQPKADQAVPEGAGLSPREAMGTRAFWLMATVYFMIGIGHQMVMVHLVAYSQGKGIPLFTAAAVLSTVSGVSIAGRIIMGFASDWVGRKRTLAICLATEGIMIFWLIGAASPGMLFLFAGIFGFAYGGHVPQLPALTRETFGLAHMGAMLGAVSFFWGVGAAIGPTLAGYVVDVTGSYSSAFIIGGIAMLLAATAGALVRKP